VAERHGCGGGSPDLGFTRARVTGSRWGLA
jgi:hypothetical protein